MAEKTAKKTSKKEAKKNTLIIVESPAKAKTIEHYLGTGYTVKALWDILLICPKAASQSM